MPSAETDIGDFHLVMSHAPYLPAVVVYRNKSLHLNVFGRLELKFHDKIMPYKEQNWSMFVLYFG